MQKKKKKYRKDNRKTKRIGCLWQEEEHKKGRSDNSLNIQIHLSQLFEF